MNFFFYSIHFQHFGTFVFYHFHGLIIMIIHLKNADVYTFDTGGLRKCIFCILINFNVDNY